MTATGKPQKFAMRERIMAEWGVKRSPPALRHALPVAGGGVIRQSSRRSDDAPARNRQRVAQRRRRPLHAPSSAMICSRITNFCGLPVAVIGNSATKRMYRGTLWWAICP